MAGAHSIPPWAYARLVAGLGWGRAAGVGGGLRGDALADVVPWMDGETAVEVVAGLVDAGGAAGAAACGAVTAAPLADALARHLERLLASAVDSDDATHAAMALDAALLAGAPPPRAAGALAARLTALDPNALDPALFASLCALRARLMLLGVQAGVDAGAGDGDDRPPLSTPRTPLWRQLLAPEGDVDAHPLAIAAVATALVAALPGAAARPWPPTPTPLDTAHPGAHAPARVAAAAVLLMRPGLPRVARVALRDTALSAALAATEVAGAAGLDAALAAAGPVDRGDADDRELALATLVAAFNRCGEGGEAALAPALAAASLFAPADATRLVVDAGMRDPGAGVVVGAALAALPALAAAHLVPAVAAAAAAADDADGDARAADRCAIFVAGLCRGAALDAGAVLETVVAPALSLSRPVAPRLALALLAPPAARLARVAAGLVAPLAALAAGGGGPVAVRAAAAAWACAAAAPVAVPTKSLTWEALTLLPHAVRADAAPSLRSGARDAAALVADALALAAGSDEGLKAVQGDRACPPGLLDAARSLTGALSCAPFGAARRALVAALAAALPTSAPDAADRALAALPALMRACYGRDAESPPVPAAAWPVAALDAAADAARAAVKAGACPTACAMPVLRAALAVGRTGGGAAARRALAVAVAAWTALAPPGGDAGATPALLQLIPHALAGGGRLAWVVATVAPVDAGGALAAAAARFDAREVRG